MVREKKQLTYKQLYKVFSIIIYSLAVLPLFLNILADRYNKPVLISIGIGIFLFTLVLGVVMAIILAVKKEKREKPACK